MLLSTWANTVKQDGEVQLHNPRTLLKVAEKGGILNNKIT
jgi:hypothetical protein